MIDLLTVLFQKIIAFVQAIWRLIFGDWLYGVLFNWLPNDIILAVDFLIIFLFGLALFNVVRKILPF